MGETFKSFRDDPELRVGIVKTANDFGVRNGSVSGSFSITPLSTLTCPGNQRVVIESVTYDLTLTGPSGLTASFSS